LQQFEVHKASYQKKPKPERKLLMDSVRNKMKFMEAEYGFDFIMNGLRMIGVNVVREILENDALMTNKPRAVSQPKSVGPKNKASQEEENIHVEIKREINTTPQNSGSNHVSPSQDPMSIDHPRQEQATAESSNSKASHAISVDDETIYLIGSLISAFHSLGLLKDLSIGSAPSDIHQDPGKDHASDQEQAIWSLVDNEMLERNGGSPCFPGMTSQARRELIKWKFRKFMLEQYQELVLSSGDWDNVENQINRFPWLFILNSLNLSYIRYVEDRQWEKLLNKREKFKARFCMELKDPLLLDRALQWWERWNAERIKIKAEKIPCVTIDD